MKILLIGNYENSRQQSMRRFAELMREGLVAAGHDVRLLCPPVILGRIRSGSTGLAKWIGYIDRFLIFPFLLRHQVRWVDVVHICDHANAVYIPHLCGKPYIITCHDMLAIRAALGEIPMSPTGWTGTRYQRWILGNLCKSRIVASVSCQTKKELNRLTGLRNDQIAIIPNSLNYSFSPMALDEASPLLQSLGLNATQPFFLHVGGNQWYKNRFGLIRLFSELIKIPDYKDHWLIMAGRPWSAEIRRLVGRLDIEHCTFEKVGVSNKVLRALYSNTEALIFPSLQEGFGWPIVEAQACGCPVITSKREPMLEVGGNAAIYIDPENEAGAVKIIAESLKERDRWKSAGLKNAARYSRKGMIESYIQCYHLTMSDNPLVSNANMCTENATQEVEGN